MWLLANTTPYAAERSWVQDKDANKIWLVVLKATFDILQDGGHRIADEQLPVLRMPEPAAGAGNVSIDLDGDLIGIKPCTDVLVRAQAWAPGGGAVRSLDAELRIGPIHKRLRVFGDRFWVAVGGGARASSPAPFESMPIVYERAYGGWDRTAEDPAEHRVDARNPIGTGFAISSRGCAEKRLPNIEYPDELIGSWNDRPRPCGLNATACHWSPRRELAGTYDDVWQKTRLPLWAADFDSRYHNSAPADQQAAAFLLGGEGVRLTNLSPDGLFQFQLPRLYPCFETRFGRERIEHRGQLCTVFIEPDRRRLSMTWQTSLVCNDRVDELDVTVITEKRVIRAAM